MSHVNAHEAPCKPFDDAVSYFRDNGFDILEAPGTSTGRIFIKKHNVSAAVERDPRGNVKIFAHPGYLVGSEIAKLVDKGYQKFLRTTKTELPATSDHLQAIHLFTEELKEATGMSSLYNESLGSVCDASLYDRVKDRDEPPAKRPQRPWEKKLSSKKRA